MLVNKIESRGSVTQIKMTEAEVLKLICENITHNEDELTGGVEEIEKGVIGIMIHEELQYEFNVADLLSIEEKVELLIRGYSEVLQDGRINVEFTDDKEYNITIDEGTYIVGFDREGNIFEVEKTDNIDLTGFELYFEYGDIDYWVKDDIGVLILRHLS